LGVGGKEENRERTADHRRPKKKLVSVLTLKKSRYRRKGERGNDAAASKKEGPRKMGSL